MGLRSTSVSRFADCFRICRQFILLRSTTSRGFQILVLRSQLDPREPSTPVPFTPPGSILPRKMHFILAARWAVNTAYFVRGVRWYFGRVRNVATVWDPSLFILPPLVVIKEAGFC